MTFIIECPYCGAENKEEVETLLDCDFVGGNDACWKCNGMFLYDTKRKRGYEYPKTTSEAG